MSNSLFNQLNQINNQDHKVTVNSIMNEVKQSGMSPKDYFFHKAKQMGVDPNSILSQLK